MIIVLFAFGYVLSICAYAGFIPFFVCQLFQLCVIGAALSIRLILKDHYLAIKLIFLLMLISLSGSVDGSGVRDSNEDLITSFLGMSFTTILVLPGAIMALRLKESLPVVFLAICSVFFSLSSLIQGYEVHELAKSIAFLLLVLFNIQMWSRIQFSDLQKREFANQILFIALFVVLSSLVLSFLLDFGYYYGNIKFAYLPFSISIIYLLPWCKFFDKRLVVIVLAIIVAAQYTGALQSSTRSLLLTMIAVLGLVWTSKPKHVLGFMAIFAPLGFYLISIDSSGNFLYKFAFLFDLDYRSVLSDPALLKLSAGNAVAELVTALYEISMNLSFPLGVGIALPDSLGLLKFSNDGAFHLYGGNAVAPLHSGFAYLLVWFGILSLILVKNLKLFLLLFGFFIFTLSYKHLLFMLVILNLFVKKRPVDVVK